jgi:large subunit ribosomal protein L32e
MTEIARLLQLRKKMKHKRPKFIRQESWRLKKLKPSWRCPRGIDNRARTKKKGHITLPSIGFKTPKKVRHLHASGFQEVIIHNMAELEQVDYRKQVAKIAHSIGRHKRVLLQDRADELNILILNRTRILLPGEELLLEEGRGFEKEAFPSKEKVSEEEVEEEEVEEEELEEELDEEESSED